MRRLAISVSLMLVVPGVALAQAPAKTAPAVSVSAQGPQPKLDQVALAKQLVGLWRLDESGDEKFFLELQPYGPSGFTASSWYATATGERMREGQRLYGYDTGSDKFVGLSVNKATARVGINVFWFTAEHRCVGFNSRNLLDASGSVSRRFEIEFKNPDEWLQYNTYPDNRPPDVERFVRVKR